MTEIEWTKQASNTLVGRKIVEVRYMSKDEARAMGWSKRPLVFKLDDGSIWYPSRDDEGNDGGTLFGQSDDGKDLSLPVMWN